MANFSVSGEELMRAAVAVRLVMALMMLTLFAGVSLTHGTHTADAQNDPLSVIEAALEVANAGDVDGFMALYADDGVFMDDACFALFGPDGCVGIGQIRAVMEVFIPDDFSWTTVLDVSGNTVTGRAEGSWGALAALGVERVLFNTRWEVTNGKISFARMEIDFSDADSVKWREALYAALGAQLPNDPFSVIDAATFTVNAGDTDGFVAFWSDDGVFEMDACYAVFGPAGCVGLDAIGAVSAMFIEDSLVWTWTQALQVSGNTVSGPAEFRVGAFAALGIERVLVDATWDVVGGKITRAHFDVVMSDPDSVKWRNAVYASVGVQPPSTGNAGLAASEGGSGSLLWLVLAVGAAVTLTLSGRLLVGRHARA
jgi:hypothetical protein